MEYLIIVYYYPYVEISAPICIPNQYTGLYIETILNLKNKTSC